MASHDAPAKTAGPDLTTSISHIMRMYKTKMAARRAHAT